MKAHIKEAAGENAAKMIHAAITFDIEEIRLLAGLRPRLGEAHNSEVGKKLGSI